MATRRDYAWEDERTLNSRENYHSITTQRRHPLTAPVGRRCCGGKANDRASGLETCTCMWGNITLFIPSTAFLCVFNSLISLVHMFALWRGSKSLAEKNLVPNRFVSENFRTYTIRLKDQHIVTRYLPSGRRNCYRIG